ncbi:hypothetical protein [Streptacidiphilus sp. EB103A]|uniref:hypothetical protein n=1 Tax=Streptacidiphilus sp. EB103A TaxID=3156275 RepID=UPI003518E921
MYPIGFENGDVRAVLLIEQVEVLQELRTAQSSAPGLLPHSYLRLTPEGRIQEMRVLGMPLLERQHQLDPSVRAALFQHRVLYAMLTDQQMPDEFSSGNSHPAAWLDALPMEQKTIGEIPVEIVGII